MGGFVRLWGLPFSKTPTSFRQLSPVSWQKESHVDVLAYESQAAP